MSHASAFHFFLILVGYYFKCWNKVRLTCRLKTQVHKKCYICMNFNLTPASKELDVNFCHFAGYPFWRGLQMSWGLKQARLLWFPLRSPLSHSCGSLLLPRLGSLVWSPAAVYHPTSRLGLAPMSCMGPADPPFPFSLWKTSSPHLLNPKGTLFLA